MTIWYPIKSVMPDSNRWFMGWDKDNQCPVTVRHEKDEYGGLFVGLDDHHTHNISHVMVGQVGRYIEPPHGHSFPKLIA